MSDNSRILDQVASQSLIPSNKVVQPDAHITRAPHTKLLIPEESGSFGYDYNQHATFYVGAPNQIVNDRVSILEGEFSINSSDADQTKFVHILMEIGMLLLKITEKKH